MTFARRLVLFLLLVTSPAGWAATARKSPTRPDSATAYKGAIVIDAATGNVLFEDRAAAVGPPASMTKLMTYAVLHDKLRAGAIALDTPVKIQRSDMGMGGTQVYLDPRETFTVEELVWAMMIQSANDAAHALARVSAGSAGAFVELMNAKAQQLGMTDTQFRTPHGLPPSSRKSADGDLTTPRDFALLSRHLIKNTDVLKYTSVRARKFGEGLRAQPMDMENHNKLLGKVAGVDGLKTGYTAAAGYCLSATAERNGRRVIAVIMGSLGPGGQRDYGRARDMKAIELIERGFSALPPAPAATAAAPATHAATATKPDAKMPTLSPAPVKAPPTESSEPPVIKFNVPKKR